MMKRLVLIMGNLWSVKVVTYMTMIRSYIPGFSKRCASCCWCIQNRMAGSTRRMQWRSPIVSGRVIFAFLPNFRFFAAILFFLNFHSFSNGQKARKPRLATFSGIAMCSSRFFPTKKKNQKKKNWCWVLRRVSGAIVTF